MRRRDLEADAEAEDHLPRLHDDKTTLEAVTDRLITTDHEHLATTRDPTATEVARLRDAHRLSELVHLHDTTTAEDDRTLIVRAISARRDAIARGARLEPSAELIARIGPRPHTPSDRRLWDAAVAAIAVQEELRDIPDHNARA